MNHPIPKISKSLTWMFIGIASFVGIALDYLFDQRIDYWIHDTAVVYQARSQWPHVAIVALDGGIPTEVSRIQALPLFALATDRLVAAGARGVFLDARISKELETRMPYAVCVETNGEIRWSMPDCSIVADNQCQMLASATGKAPLAMKADSMAHFSIAPFPSDQAQLPNFLLFGSESEKIISQNKLQAADRLITRDNPIARWIDMSPDHAAYRLAQSIKQTQLQETLSDQNQNSKCDNNQSCKRIRLSKPIYKLRQDQQILFMPVSQWASCDGIPAEDTRKMINNKVIIFQLTAPDEMTDLLVTPMTTAFFSPKQLTPGAQYLADAVETLLNADYPRRPDRLTSCLLFIMVATASVSVGVHFRQIILWLLGLMIFLMMASLCLFNHRLQLWPVTAVIATFLVAFLLTTGIKLLIGIREGKLANQYLPQQAHDLLIKLKIDENFIKTSAQVVVLMSDIEGYTTITGILQQPENLLNLMNDYLDETSSMLHDKYHGWFESYVGDMLCYYWPCFNSDREQIYKKAILAALELSALQQRFFSSVTLRYKEQFTPDALVTLQKTINAGVALTSGLVVMGDLGPKQGVKKFGILGDPLNLVSRVEALTRLFNTEIIITGDLLQYAQSLKIPTRRLGFICVKGRSEPVMLYAIGTLEDERFATDKIMAWETWLTETEKYQRNSDLPCPGCYQQDRSTLVSWLKRGLLNKQGIWNLQEK